MIGAAGRLSFCLVALLVAAHPSMAADVTAQTSGIAAGRDITGTVNIGPSPEQLRALTQGVTAPLTAAIIDLSRRIDKVPPPAVPLLRSEPVIGKIRIGMSRSELTTLAPLGKFYKDSTDFKWKFQYKFSWILDHDGYLYSVDPLVRVELKDDRVVFVSVVLVRSPMQQCGFSQKDILQYLLRGFGPPFSESKKPIPGGGGPPNDSIWLQGMSEYYFKDSNVGVIYQSEEWIERLSDQMVAQERRAVQSRDEQESRGLGRPVFSLAPVTSDKDRGCDLKLYFVSIPDYR